MILTLYLFLVTFSLVLIGIGLLKPSESAQAIIGFFFLFLLSFQILNGTLTYETGATISTVYGYNGSTLSSSSDTIIYSETTFQHHYIGYYMALGSAIGLIGVIFSLARTNWGRE